HRRTPFPPCGRAHVSRAHRRVGRADGAAGRRSPADTLSGRPWHRGDPVDLTPPRSTSKVRRGMTPRAWWLFALSSGVWGVPYLFIRVAVDAGVPPAFVAWARVALAAALLLPVALHRGALRGLRGRAGAVAAYAACEIAVPFVLIAIGERYISSSLTAILIDVIPSYVTTMAVHSV